MNVYSTMEQTIFIVYTVDTILLGSDTMEIKSIFKNLDATFKIEDQRNLSDYLGIKITRNPLTQSILKD